MERASARRPKNDRRRLILYLQGKSNVVPWRYSLAQQAQKLGLAPWELEQAIDESPRVARWMRYLQGVWALEADDTINRMRE